MSNQKSQRIHYFAAPFTVVLASLLIQIPAFSQEEAVDIPEHFVIVPEASKRLDENIASVQEQFKANYDGRRFWLGYQFELRQDVDFRQVYIHDDGGITLSRHGDISWYEDADLQTHILHALGELGDEEARKKLKEKKRELKDTAKRNWGLFFLLEADDLTVNRVKIFHLHAKRAFYDYPVFWLTDVGNNESFGYVKTLVENERYSKRVVKPAIFVLSLHEHPQVIPYLAGVVGGNRYVEIRKSAAFWLGQIPDEASFNALSDIYAREQNHEMKKKLVFAIGQHKSEKAVNFLASIARSDEVFEVREKAVFWLGQIDSEESLDVLLQFLNQTRDTELKEKAVFSISQHDSKRAAAKLIEVAKNERNRDVRKKAIFWLGQMAGRKTLQALGDIVENDDETEAKTKAVFAISQHDDKDLAFDMLRDIAKNNPNPEVRKKAIFWMGQMGDERAVDFFKEILIKNE